MQDDPSLGSLSRPPGDNEGSLGSLSRPPGDNAWLLPSKLTAPSPPADWLSRELVPINCQLTPLTFLVAGPGYGKTLGLLSLVAPKLAAGVPVLWLSLDLYDTDPATFFHYLVAGMRRHIPQFGEEVKALLLGDKLEPRLLWQRFFQAIAAYNLPEVYLVLDDFHNLQENQPELVKALVYFYDKLPPRTHLLLSSRTKLKASFSKAQTRGDVTLLDEETLRFTAEEEVAFMVARAPGGVIPNSWWKKATGLDGWPLGLDLATSVGADRDLQLDPRATGVEPLTGYVAEELYEAQPADRRHFMLRAALLPELSTDACQVILQAPDAAEVLAGLEADHLVRRLASSDAYRFPTYLRDFLLGESEHSLRESERVESHHRAAGYYLDRSQDELALPHLIASADWPRAMAACERSFPSMRFSGRQSLIWRWLDTFPADVVAREPVLQVWRGHLFSRSGQHKAAQPAYARARELFAARGDDAGVFKVMVRETTIALIHQELRTNSAAMLAALDAMPGGRPEDIVDAYLAHALAAEQDGNMVLMRAYNERVLQLAIDANIEMAASHCIALMNLFTIALHLGDLEAAHRHIAGVISLSEAWEFPPYVMFAKFLQAHLRLTEGDVDAAATFFKALPPHWKDQLDWHDLACAYTTLGYWAQFKGEHKEAEELLQTSIETFEKAGFQEGQKVALERLLWLAVARKQYVRAPDLLAQAGEMTTPTIYDLALLTPYGRAMHLQGHTEAALKAFADAVTGFEAQGARLHLARVLLYQGATLLKIGDDAGAEAVVTRGLQLAETHRYRFLPGADQVLWEELAGLVTRQRIIVGFVEQALSAQAMHPVTLAVVPAEGGSYAGTTTTASLERPAPGSLSLRCFGGFEARLDGVLLDQWPRRKAKLILAALLLYRRGLSLAQLLEVLGGEAISQGALTTIKVDVSSLRRALEPGLGKGQESRFVVTADERYMLAWSTIEYTDLQAFDDGMVQGDMVRDAQPLEAVTAYEAALSHYRGNLLDDGFFARYFEAEREKYRQQVVAVLLWMARFHQDLGDMTSAESALTRAVELAPTEEDAYIALMRHQKAVGRAERIRQVYWDCRKALKAYLGMTPSPEFEAAYLAIAKGA